VIHFLLLLHSTLQQQQQETNAKDSYLADFARNTNIDVIYSIGSHCTNLSSQQNMDQYSFDQSEADTIIFSFHAVLRESGYAGPVVIDATNVDVYIAAACISYQLPGMLCIKRKQ